MQVSNNFSYTTKTVFVPNGIPFFVCKMKLDDKKIETISYRSKHESLQMALNNISKNYKYKGPSKKPPKQPCGIDVHNNM